MMIEQPLICVILVQMGNYIRKHDIMNPSDGTSKETIIAWQGGVWFKILDLCSDLDYWLIPDRAIRDMWFEMLCDGKLGDFSRPIIATVIQGQEPPNMTDHKIGERTRRDDA